MPPFNPKITMRVLTTEGLMHLVVPDPFERSLVGTHWNAIDAYLSGDPSALRELHADVLDAPDPLVAGKQLSFDERQIAWYASRGQTGEQLVIGVCMVCDREQEIEQNHLAGRTNDSTTMLPFCIDDHRLFTGRQHGAGVTLAPGPRDVIDRIRGLLIGAAITLELFTYRRRGFVRPAPELWRLIGRFVSRLLEVLRTRERGRSGRELPDARRVWHTQVRQLPLRRDFDDHFDDFADELGFAIVQSLKSIAAEG